MTLIANYAGFSTANKMEFLSELGYSYVAIDVMTVHS